MGEGTPLKSQASLEGPPKRMGDVDVPMASAIRFAPAAPVAKEERHSGSAVGLQFTSSACAWQR
jgi:hypothetical protein